jgi:hypothetical protein
MSIGHWVEEDCWTESTRSPRPLGRRSIDPLPHQPSVQAKACGMDASSVLPHREASNMGEAPTTTLEARCSIGKHKRGIDAHGLEANARGRWVGGCTMCLADSMHESFTTRAAATGSASEAVASKIRSQRRRRLSVPISFGTVWCEVCRYSTEYCCHSIRGSRAALQRSCICARIVASCFQKLAPASSESGACQDRRAVHFTSSAWGSFTRSECSPSASVLCRSRTSRSCLHAH